MRTLTVLAALVASPVWAGDEYHMPTLREGTAYQSSEPSYRVVGIADHDGEATVYVVADPKVVLTQKGVNRILKDITKRGVTFTEISFYRAVGEKPQFPAFYIGDGLALYLPKDNKTYYGVAAGKQYGSWVYGPAK